MKIVNFVNEHNCLFEVRREFLNYGRVELPFEYILPRYPYAQDEQHLIMILISQRALDGKLKYYRIIKPVLWQSVIYYVLKVISDFFYNLL